MTDEDLHHELMRAGLSLNTAASAVDVFRQVCQAIDKGANRATLRVALAVAMSRSGARRRGFVLSLSPIFWTCGSAENY